MVTMDEGKCVVHVDQDLTRTYEGEFNVTDGHLYVYTRGETVAIYAPGHWTATEKFGE